MVRARKGQEWFCSELVAEAYRHQKIMIVGSAAGYTAPSALAESRHTRYKFTVKPEGEVGPDAQVDARAVG